MPTARRSARIYRLINELARQPENTIKTQLLEMVRYDLNLRQQTALKSGLADEYMTFLLGRPLVETLRALGLKVWTDGDRWQLQILSPYPPSFNPMP